MSKVTNHIVASIARVCHEANAAWCRQNGDQTQKSWRDAEPWQRDAAIRGVRYLIANPDAGDSALHDQWADGLRADGWAFGPMKDPVRKLHPCLIPFEELGLFQQFKDVLFRTIVRASVGTV